MSPTTCNEAEIRKMTNELIDKSGQHDFTEFTIEVSEDSIHYFVMYSPADTLVVGGGGEFKVVKNGCKIVSGTLYQ